MFSEKIGEDYLDGDGIKVLIFITESDYQHLRPFGTPMALRRGHQQRLHVFSFSVAAPG